MGEFAAWDLGSRAFLFDTLVMAYGWVLVVAVIAPRLPRTAPGSWQHLPVLCWGLVSAWRHLELLWWRTSYHGPPPQVFWVVAYESLLGLCAVCAVQVGVLTLAGRPAWALGAFGRYRMVMIVVLLTVILDIFFTLRFMGIWRL